MTTTDTNDALSEASDPRDSAAIHDAPDPHDSAAAHDSSDPRDAAGPTGADSPAGPETHEVHDRGGFPDGDNPAV